ncbi:NERD domain-containing protein, partial [Thiolapillus sp.]
MAHLIPTLSVEEIDNKPERDVARALLEQLPNHVIVYHSYPWLRPDRNDRSKKTTLKEGEADFLILWPELGLLVLEVKGGEIRYDSDGRRWYRRLPNGKERDIRDPFEQANKNM